MGIRKVRVGSKDEVWEKNGYQAYTQEIFGNGRKHGWYVVLAKGTQNISVPRENKFRTKKEAQRFMAKWLRSK